MYMIWGIAAIAFIMLDAAFAMLFGVYLSLGALGELPLIEISGFLKTNK